MAQHATDRASGARRDATRIREANASGKRGSHSHRYGRLPSGRTPGCISDERGDKPVPAPDRAGRVYSRDPDDHVVASVLRIGGAVTHLAQRLDSAETRGTVLRAVLISCGIGLVGALALVPVNEASVPHATPMVALVPFALPAMLLTDSMSGFMLATGRVSIANRVQFVSPALGLATMAILVVAFGLGLTGALIGWMFGQWAAAVAALFSCRSVLRQSSVASKAWTIWDRGSRQMMAFAIRFGIVGAISVINYRIDLILLRGFHGVHDVGIYSLAVSLADWVGPVDEPRNCSHAPRGEREH